MTLLEAAEDYLTKTKASKSSKTYTAYRRALDLFKKSCTKIYLDQIVKGD
jgi:hypothetical protein